MKYFRLHFCKMLMHCVMLHSYPSFCDSSKTNQFKNKIILVIEDLPQFHCFLLVVSPSLENS